MLTLDRIIKTTRQMVSYGEFPRRRPAPVISDVLGQQDENPVKEQPDATHGMA